MGWVGGYRYVFFDFFYTRCVRIDFKIEKFLIDMYEQRNS